MSSDVSGCAKFALHMLAMDCICWPCIAYVGHGYMS